MESKGLPAEGESVSARLVAFYFTLLAVFGPAFLLMWWFPPSNPSFEMWGMIWELYYSSEYGRWYFDNYWLPFIIANSIMYTFLRPVFAYQMVRLYQGKSTMKQTLLVGLFIELQTLIIDIPMILIMHRGLYLIHIPIPILLLAAIIMMRYKPPSPRTKSWVEDEQEHSDWLDVEKKIIAKTRDLRGVTLNKVLETILIAEIILLIFGGLIVAIVGSWQFQAFYGQALPSYILITGILYLMTLPTKK